MSGDVQPRKRKDKKRKREDEPREQHQGVHGSKMGNEDVHLHVQGDHETGGHWCAKLFFFSLLAILLGLIGLIILENRGLADLDTPLSESRFSNYFDGWVDEHREAHDEHDAVTASIEEHEHGDEPFEEEEDHSEIDEADDEEEKDHEEDEEDDEENEEDEENTKENEEDNDNETDEVEAETAEEGDDETQENDDENTVEDSVEETREDDEDEEADEKNDDDNDDEETNENNDNKDDDDEEDEEDEDTTEDVEPPQTRSHQSYQQASSAQSKTKEDDDNDDDDEPFEEEDDDGTFESLESVVDNDAEELLILQEKARQQQANLKKEEPEAEEEPSSYTSSLAVKIGVGVALALVARLVLVRKNPNTNDPPAEVLMKRRLTIAAPEDTFSEDHDELLEYDVNMEDEAMNLEQSGEEEYIEEEIEEEEEIEVTDEEYEEEKIEKPLNYEPQTFEQLNAMYRRPNEFQPTEMQHETPKKASPPKFFSQEPKTSNFQEYSQREENIPVATSKPSQSRFAQYRREKTPPPAQVKLTQLSSNLPPQETEVPIKLQQMSSNLQPQETAESKDSRVDSDEHEEDIEYDDEELYDDEMLDEEEEEEIGDDEEDEEDLSDVDDSELMNRLEAKYGRLPAKEFESDEDVEDQSWTKIKPRGGGPQSMDDDEFEEELKKANEEMLRENLNSALTLFESLSRKFPDKPEAFLGKAKILDKQSEIQRSNSKLIQALDAYKRYLAFGEDILNDKEFSEVAERCVDRMRFMGLHLQAVPIHEMLIERHPNEVSHRNQLAVTYLMLNRLSDAKHALEENLSRWPNDGFAMAHYGFVLKNLNQNLHLAVDYLRRGIDSQSEGTQDGRFYFNLGDILQRLGRLEEAREIYRRGAALKLFLSEYQRSLYNEESLRAQPFWSKKETGYEDFLNHIEKNWRVIRDEGLSALNAKGAFENESENLRDSGDWQQFELFARGQRRKYNCLEAPVTCGIIEMFPSARFCKRGQVKFSVMNPGTHIWPHCGPTNCRLRAHLGLKVPPGTLLRVAEEKRTWQEGKFLIFDDSFEHEVWHNGSSPRLVLIVDIWHPDLTEQQRQSLTPI